MITLITVITVITVMTGMTVILLPAVMSSRTDRGRTWRGGGESDVGIGGAVSGIGERGQVLQVCSN